MNIYKYTFLVGCPNDGVKIKYQLTIKSATVIMAEDIVKFCSGSEGYQEYIAQVLKEKLSCERLKLVGIHSGVKIISRL